MSHEEEVAFRLETRLHRQTGVPSLGGRIIWRRWAAGPPSGSPWLLCSAVSWRGRRPAARPRPEKQPAVWGLWLPPSGSARPPSPGSAAETAVKRFSWRVQRWKDAAAGMLSHSPRRQRRCWSPWFPSDSLIHPGCKRHRSGRAATTDRFTVFFLLLTFSFSLSQWATDRIRSGQNLNLAGKCE